MHHTLSTEQHVWSSFDQFWAVFCGELLGNDVISWPCSFRAWNNTFRDSEALGLWTYMIGVAVPKNVYNTYEQTVKLFMETYPRASPVDNMERKKPSNIQGPILTFRSPMEQCLPKPSGNLNASNLVWRRLSFHSIGTQCMGKLESSVEPSAGKSW